jgi:ethanolamine utilization cobalamin adenosyltransferase
MFSLSSAASLSATLVCERSLEVKLTASSKALKDAQTRLAVVEDKCKKDVPATEAKAAKEERSLAEAKQRQAKHEQAVVERINSLSKLFGSKYYFSG